MRFTRFLLCGWVGLWLGGCATTETPQNQIEAGKPGDLIPKSEPKSRFGNPDSYVVFGERYYVLPTARGFREQGVASWYGEPFHGRLTSNREVYDMYGLSAAHKTLPLPTFVRVTNLDNHRSLILRVNDRGPFVDNRVIDLSYAAATRLGVVGKGTAAVEVRAITSHDSELVDDQPPENIQEPSAAEMASIPPPPPRPVSAPKSLPAISSSAPKSTVSATPLQSFTVFQRLNQPGAKLFLQVGSFGSETNAQRMRKDLSRQLNGFPVNVVRSGKSPDFFRVHIGPLTTAQQMDELDRRLALLGIKDRHVLIE